MTTGPFDPLSQFERGPEPVPAGPEGETGAELASQQGQTPPLSLMEQAREQGVVFRPGQVAEEMCRKMGGELLLGLGLGKLESQSMTGYTPKQRVAPIGENDLLMRHDLPEYERPVRYSNLEKDIFPEEIGHHRRRVLERLSSDSTIAYRGVVSYAAEMRARAAELLSAATPEQLAELFIEMANRLPRPIDTPFTRLGSLSGIVQWGPDESGARIHTTPAELTERMSEQGDTGEASIS